MQHEQGHAAWTWTCRREMHLPDGHDLQHGHRHAAWSWACIMVMGMYHGHGHSACSGTCIMDMDMQYGHEYAAWTWIRSLDVNMDKQHVPSHADVYVHATSPYPCCISKSILHIHVHTVCTSMLHVHTVSV